MSKYDPTRPVSSIKHDDKRAAIPPKTSSEIIHNYQFTIHNSQLGHSLHIKHSTLNTQQEKPSTRKMTIFFR